MTGWHEKAVWFGSPHRLFGITSVPPDMRGVGAILMNPGTLHRVGGARLNVRLARRLADQGIPSIRFDVSGLGDSDTRLDALSYNEGMVSDVRLAMDELERHCGVSRFVLIGHCTGAAMSYHTALADGRVGGLVQLEGFAYRTRQFAFHHWRRLVLSRRNWVALLSGRMDLRPALRRALGRVRPRRQPTPVQAIEAQSVEEARQRIRGLADLLPPQAEMRRGLEVLVARGVPMLHIYAGGDHHYYAYRRQFADAFPGLDFRGLLELEHVVDANHYFSAPRHQVWLDNRILAWMIARLP